MTGFTPGPWDFERGADSKPRPWIGRLEDNAYSALACGETHEESMANAALIAAAPELYASLRGLLIAFQSDGPFPRESIERAEAAIAKARGEHP